MSSNPNREEDSNRTQGTLLEDPIDAVIEKLLR